MVSKMLEQVGIRVDRQVLSSEASLQKIMLNRTGITVGSTARQHDHVHSRTTNQRSVLRLYPKLGELSCIKDHFAKFVPDAVKRIVTANPEAPELAKRERDVSVLFLDISW